MLFTQLSITRECFQQNIFLPRKKNLDVYLQYFNFRFIFQHTCASHRIRINSSNINSKLIFRLKRQISANFHARQYVSSSWNDWEIIKKTWMVALALVATFLTGLPGTHGCPSRFERGNPWWGISRWTAGTQEEGLSVAGQDERKRRRERILGRRSIREGTIHR